MAIFNLAIRETPYAVVALKTTGLTSGYDRICEISVVRAEAGQPLRLTLDTVVDPDRELRGSEVHGVTPMDVSEAPTLAELSGEVVRELAGRVLVGYNMTFILRFLHEELRSAGVKLQVPFLDLMTLHAMLSRGRTASLGAACESHGIQPHRSHLAAAHALDTGKLLRAIIGKLGAGGMTTFASLQGKGQHAFQRSLDLDPLGLDLTWNLPECVRRVSRYESQTLDDTVNPLSTYYDELLVSLEDLLVTDDELERMAGLKEELGLADEDVYGLHARIFAGELMALIESDDFGDDKRERLRGIQGCLSRLGWAPGA